MNRPSPKVSQIASMGWALLAGGITAVLFFLLTFITGLNIAADPANMDTGMVAVLVSPFYGIAALLAGLVVFLRVARQQKRPWPMFGLPNWRRWLLALLLALVAGLITLMGLVSLVNSVTSNDALAPALSAPLWVLLSLSTVVLVLRLVRPSTHRA